MATGADARLLALLRGHVTTQLIASAVRFRIPDHLHGAARTEAELAELTGIGRAELRRYLPALEGLGLVEAVEPGVYRGTELAGLLHSRTGLLHGQALMAGAEYTAAWASLDHALRTGRSAFEHSHGVDLWTHLRRNEEVAASFTRTMRWNTTRDLGEILGLYDFTGVRVVADLGAGHGTLVAGLLTRFPDLRAIVFEQPSVIGHALRAVTELGLADRCRFVAGDFLDAVPAGADLYVLKAVLHNWDDATVVRILANCREVIGPDARLLVVERALNTERSLDAAVRDLTMLVLFGGQDRTPEGYRALVERAGFEVTRTATGATGTTVLEARPGAPR